MFDVLRNGLTVTRVDESDPDLSKTKHNTQYMEFNWDFYLCVLPIPKHEMDANGSMVQNPGY